jgi:putative FmdB family regulatory protein
MPLYSHECQECQHVFDVWAKMDERNDPSECPECGAVNSKPVITKINFITPGDGWASKNNRIKGQMRKKSERLREKSRERSREQPVATLAPNVDGERTESWADAQKLAKDKGKNTDSYAPMVAKEQKAKSA